MNDTFISVIIPCRNEENFIKDCLDSIVQQDYQKDMMEVLVVDGMSDDTTADIVRTYEKKYTFIKLFSNPKKIVPTALNIGIKNALGDIIIRVDSHAIYPRNYFSTLVHYAKKLNADNVGGALITLPANNSRTAKSIAIVLSSPFGVGNARYRLDGKRKREYFETDTVPFGCYKRNVFNRIGLYDEDLIRNQDNEFNERLKKAGGKIYIVPSLKIRYFARSNYKKLFKMLFQYGYFGPLVDLKLKRPTRIRRYIPTLFVLSITLPLLFAWISGDILLISLMVASIYFIMAILFAIKESCKRKQITLIPYVVLGFVVSHISYGLGYLKGIVDFVILKKDPKRLNTEISR